jgi:hypothetical protein
MMNLRLSQQEFLKTFSNKINPIPEFALNPIKALIEMPLGYFNHLNHMTNVGHRLPIIRFAQSTIGKDSGRYCRKHTNKVMKYLESLGLVISVYHHRRPKTYQLSAWFLIPAVRLMLMHLLPALALCIYLEVTPLKSLSKLNKKYDCLSQYDSLSNSTVQIESSKTASCGDEELRDERLIKKSEREMNNSIEKKQSIDNILSLKLTKSGKNALLAFDSEAIDAADFNGGSSKAKTFAEFVNLCKVVSKERDLKIDWTHYYYVTRHLAPGEALFEKTNQSQVHRQTWNNNPSVSYAGTASRRSADTALQKGGKVGLFSTQESPEYLEKLRQSELRYPTRLQEWQTKMPHQKSLYEGFNLGPDGKPLPITYNEAMRQIYQVETHAADPRSAPLIRILGKELFDANIKAQCERIMDLVDHTLKDEF